MVTPGKGGSAPPAQVGFVGGGSGGRKRGRQGNGLFHIEAEIHSKDPLRFQKIPFEFQKIPFEFQKITEKGCCQLLSAA